jgi:acyl-coenzyme A thioesterase PaaI-like protein
MMSEPTPWTFGEAPLAETLELAAALRDLAGNALALEHPSPEIRQLTAQVRAVDERLQALLPRDLRPRIGPDADADQRVYIDHSRDVGDYNPCFPRYRLTCADGQGEGEVDFPILYEGPPGIVHGGFIALLFDCVLQQLNCDLGQAGKTASLNVRYRRPTPLNTTLRIVASREVLETRIHSNAQLHLGDELLCEAEMTAVAGRRDGLPPVSPRRPPA